MKTAFCIIAFLLLYSTTPAQVLNFQWAHSYGDVWGDAGFSVVTDAQGNVYHTGQFQGTVDMDPGPGVYNITSYSFVDIFISKLDAQGNFIWAKHIGNDGQGSSEEPYSIKLDPAGNIIIAGNFAGVMDFDPGPGNFTMTTNGATAPATVFILKLDADGNFIWAEKLGDGVPVSYAFEMKLDAGGNIYISGWFEGSVDFDPGAGVHNLTSINNNADGFVLKLNNGGNFVWVAQFSGDGDMKVSSIGIDAVGNVYTCGWFSSVGDFDPGPGIYNLTASGSTYTDAFLSKLDANGNFVWAKRFGGDKLDYGNNLDLDATGNIYLTGYFIDQGDYDPGPGVINLIGNPAGISSYLLKMDAAGNLVWAKSLGDATGEVYSRYMTLDAQGNIYLTGSFGGTVDFDFGPGTQYLPNAGSLDIFLAKYDANGNFIIARSIGGTTVYDAPGGIYVDALNNIYLTGDFTRDADFDPTAAQYIMTSANNNPLDAFILKWSQCNTPTSSDITTTSCGPYTLNSQQYTISGIYTQKLINVAGCDSTITLHLTVGNPISTTQTATACDSYTWEGQTYTTSGHYSKTFTGYLGCDSIRNLDLQIFSSQHTVVSAVICEGQNFAGYTTTGTYIDRYTAKNGCDSVRTLQLMVTPRSRSDISAIICEGDSYLGYNVSGLYRDTLVAASGCDSIRTLHLVVNPKKQTTISIAICEGESWFAGGANQTTAGIYTDFLHTYLGCDSIVITNLTVKPKPDPSLGADRDICEGQSLTLNPGNFDTYLWQDMSNSPTFTVTNSGKYWVKTTRNNCSATDTILIKNKTPLPSNFLRAGIDSLCLNEKAQLRSMNTYASYNWSTGSTQSSIEIDQPGTYSLTVRDTNGCVGSDEIVIFGKICGSGIFFPNAFTPNNDGSNDVFRAKSYSKVLSFRLEIYNRNGELVFRTTDVNKGWDGIYKGIAVPTAVFVYQCSYQLEGMPAVYKKGTLLLAR